MNSLIIASGGMPEKDQETKQPSQRSQMITNALLVTTITASLGTAFVDLNELRLALAAVGFISFCTAASRISWLRSLVSPTATPDPGKFYRSKGGRDENA